MNDDDLGKALLMIVSFCFSIGLMKLTFTKTNISGKNINVGTVIIKPRTMGSSSGQLEDKAWVGTSAET